MDRLVNEGDLVELIVSYSRGRLRKAYRIDSVSSPEGYKGSRKIINLAYRSAQSSQY